MTFINMKKFYKITTVVISVALFIAGLMLIIYMNTTAATAGSENDGNKMNDIFKPFLQSKEPFNILVLGGDKVNRNSDTMMLVNFDPSTYKINVMSIPRDTKALINKKYHKINYAFPNGGIDLTVKTVSNLLDVNIKYYVFVDTTAFRNIIDILGGVTLYIPPGMDYDDPTQDLHIHLKEGMQTLNGEESEQFVRFRHPNYWAKATKKELMKYYDGSDLKRVEAQQRFITSLIDQKLNIQYLSRLNSIVNVVFENIETNFTLNELLKLSSSFGKLSTENVTFLSLPGEPLDQTPWYYICDIEKARELTAANFVCKDSFVAIEDNTDDAYGSGYKKVTSTKSSTSTETKKDTASASKTDTTQNNPSNADSSLTGSQSPAP